MNQANQILDSRLRNKWIIYIGIPALSSTLLSWLFGTGQAVHATGEIASFQEVRTATLKTLFVNIPIIGFILGTIVSLFPYKGATYTQKYLRSSLLATLVLEAVVFIFTVIGSLYAVFIRL